MMIECIKEGFRLANRNPQLVFIRIGLTVVNIVAFVILVGAPVLAAVAYLGLDLSRVNDLLPSLLQNPFGLLSKYMGLLFLAGVSVVLYLLASSVFIIYVFGGIIGSLRNSAVHMRHWSGLLPFLREANRNISGLLRLVLILSFYCVLIVVFLTISVGIAAALSHAFTEHETRTGVFFGSFILLSVLAFSGMIFMAGLIFAVYSIVIHIVENCKAAESVRKTFAFMTKRPSAILFYMVLLAGLMSVNIVFFLLRMAFDAAPVIAPFATLFLALMGAFFESYLSVAIWASLIAYYLKGTNYPVYSSMYEI